uniref:uncharacterized protein isoform X2 n=1 Tax=Pristiophorus japonicus TaxID=55135 RepID=UPI00398F1697
MRGSRGKVLPLPAARPLSISLLVRRCVSIGEGPGHSGPARAADTRRNWRASVRGPLLPALEAAGGRGVSEVRREQAVAGPESRPPPTSHARRITVDLRAALAGVQEPSEQAELPVIAPLTPRETPPADRHTDPQPAPANTGSSQPRAAWRTHESKAQPSALCRLRLPLPPIASPGSPGEPGSDCPPASTTLSLLQVTEDGILANADHHLDPASSRSHRTVAFPKMKEMSQSFIESIEESRIPFHQLLCQVRDRTSSVNHVLITEVLKSLREELWSTPEQSLLNQGTTLGTHPVRRNVPRYRRAENRAAAQAKCMSQPSDQCENKLPARICLFKNR